MSGARARRAPAPIATSEPPPAPVEGTCAACVFWNHSGTTSGVCFRYPPQMLAGMGPHGVRPVLMAATRGCGEYLGQAEPPRPAGFKP